MTLYKSCRYVHLQIWDDKSFRWELKIQEGIDFYEFSKEGCLNLTHQIISPLGSWEIQTNEEKKKR